MSRLSLNNINEILRISLESSMASIFELESVGIPVSGELRGNQVEGRGRGGSNQIGRIGNEQRNLENAIKNLPREFSGEAFRRALIIGARAEVGVSAPRDTKRSPRVDQYTTALGDYAVGQNWCAAFVSFVVQRVAQHYGVRPLVRTGGAVAYFQRAVNNELVKTFSTQDVIAGNQRIMEGDIFVMISRTASFPGHRRLTEEEHDRNIENILQGRGIRVPGHIGFCTGIYDQTTNVFGTIEGNTTSGEGGRRESAVIRAARAAPSGRDGGQVHLRGRVLDPKIIVGFCRLYA